MAINWRTKRKIEAEAIDNYKKLNQLEEYAPPQQLLVNTSTPVPEFPSPAEVGALMEKIQNKLYEGIVCSDKEETKTNFDMAMVHIRSANRYLYRAFGI